MDVAAAVSAQRFDMHRGGWMWSLGQMPMLYVLPLGGTIDRKSRTMRSLYLGVMWAVLMADTTDGFPEDPSSSHGGRVPLDHSSKEMRQWECGNGAGGKQ